MSVSIGAGWTIGPGWIMGSIPYTFAYLYTAAGGSGGSGWGGGGAGGGLAYGNILTTPGTVYTFTVGSGGGVGATGGDTLAFGGRVYGGTGGASFNPGDPTGSNAGGTGGAGSVAGANGGPGNYSSQTAQPYNTGYLSSITGNSVNYSTGASGGAHDPVNGFNTINGNYLGTYGSGGYGGGYGGGFGGGMHGAVIISIPSSVYFATATSGNIVSTTLVGSNYILVFGPGSSSFTS
jgi:hypothetical protein